MQRLSIYFFNFYYMIKKKLKNNYPTWYFHYSNNNIMEILNNIGFIIFKSMSLFNLNNYSLRTKTLQETEIPNDILVLIFDYLPFQQLIRLEILSKRIQQLIRSTLWEKIIVAPKTLNGFYHIIHNYSFRKYDLSKISDSVTDITIELLQITIPHLHTLNLSNCYKITDKSAPLLGNLDELNIEGYCGISEECILMLSNTCRVLKRTPILDSSMACTFAVRNEHLEVLRWAIQYPGTLTNDPGEYA